MTGGAIPRDIRRFLVENIGSIAQWEGLLLLLSSPEKSWKADELARSLYISGPETSALLADLAARSIITSVDDGPSRLYRYQPASAAQDALIRRTADIYRKALIPITNIIHAKARSRVQEFADAFRIRKD